MGKRKRSVLGGFACGVVATLAMSGYSMMHRRVTAPRNREQPINHYERVGERLVAIARGEEGLVELDHPERVRLGEGLHYAFGGVAGAAYVLFEDRIPAPRNLKGAVWATALWAGAFGGYFPLLGIKEPVWQWPREELTRPFLAHQVYGNTLMLLTRGLQASRS